MTDKTFRTAWVTLTWVRTFACGTTTLTIPCASFLGYARFRFEELFAGDLLGSLRPLLGIKEVRKSGGLTGGHGLRVCLVVAQVCDLHPVVDGLGSGPAAEDML